MCHLCMRHAAKGHLAGMSAFGLRYLFESFIGLAPFRSAALQSPMIAAKFGRSCEENTCGVCAGSCMGLQHWHQSFEHLNW